MIVRESPKSRRGTVQNNQPNWPPQSPAEALLSSPSGRKKYESRRERGSVSPSPSKRRPMSLHTTNDDTEEEDEETLQLKLQAIEARLKIKALQKKKAADSESFGSSAPSSSADNAQAARRPNMFQPAADIQVPHSPVRIRRAPEEQKSPARVLLGIDKGLKARDISLKRPGTGMSGRLSRADSQRRCETPKIKSFSERIAESRIKEKEREDKEMKIETRRSRGFGLHSIEGLRERTASRPESSLSAGTTSSQTMLPPPARGHSRAQSQSNSTPQPPSTPRPGLTRSSFSDASRPPSSASKSSFSSFGSTSTAAKYAEISQRDNSTEAVSFEANSGLHLKSREMPHNDVTRALEGKTILTIPQLLKTVRPPDYDAPDYENDYVVLGVICAKSTPHSTKNAAKDQSKSNQEQGDTTSKFMVLKLTDLKYEMDLFLFDTGFSQFWKLPLGTLIAVLNPDIMPPRGRDNGKFNLKLSSSDDTILELGRARDLDFCHAKKADGQGCKAWIDSRKTEYCEFHIQLQVEKSKRGRMEINTMTGMGNGPRGGGMFGRFNRGAPKGAELKREGRYHDRELHETIYIAPAPGGAARLIDRDRQQWEGGVGREDRFRKQLAEKEKERELAKKLGTMGDGSTGGDYMKVKGAGTQNLPARGYTSAQGSTGMKAEKASDTDYSSLLNRTSADVSLAPVKRKRTASTKSTTTSDPVGWGFRYGRIPSPKKVIQSAFQGTRDASPVKKKARLLLPEKGIREPGRESLGGLDIGLIAAMDDDDDDLEVV
ncbi:hypothetical protein IAQ61_002508 [Plenodomus lingam]|uniref:uncharacterized protein n=1 Tax=Leptosphaeria maculans TaxID=5022 RepID=UPI003329753D|nr:hypothetical protein IAQ61_002508 [Plenodomus lingam]